MCRNDIVLILLTAIEFVNLVIRVIKLIPPSETTKLSSASEPKIEGLCPAIDSVESLRLCRTLSYENILRTMYC